MAGFHIDRISEDIKREIISLMREIKDPRVAGKMLTVINVTVSSDLSYAKVYVSDMNGIESAKEACKGLTSAQGYIRHALGNNLHLRKAPELTFIADDSVKKGMEIFEKLKDN
ncbi:MAG: 30S ribosome-binding factor RbfA [Clostridiales bacterium]|nr:30S ribosome-binding factor RbfA [Clostridiales bacterium]MCD7872583.1 30S ribosome-binding factor RbfA [Clostridiales bacterium]